MRVLTIFLILVCFGTLNAQNSVNTSKPTAEEDPFVLVQGTVDDCLFIQLWGDHKMERTIYLGAHSPDNKKAFWARSHIEGIRTTPGYVHDSKGHAIEADLLNWMKVTFMFKDSTVTTLMYQDGVATFHKVGKELSGGKLATKVDVVDNDLFLLGNGTMPYPDKKRHIMFCFEDIPKEKMKEVFEEFFGQKVW